MYSYKLRGVKQRERWLFSVVMWMNTYLHIFPEFLQEHLLVLHINVDLLSVIDEVVVLVGGQLLGLPISIGD